MFVDHDLALTARHVIEGRRRVARQRALILKLRNVGCCMLDAEQTLEVFRSTLTNCEEREQYLIAEEQRLGLAGG